MSDPTKVPMICEDCGGTLTDDVAIWSSRLGTFEHINFSQCISSLGERLALATKRAETAEAERDAAIKRAEAAVAVMHGYREGSERLAEENVRLRAERDALRTVDDAMVERFLRAYAECEGEREQTFTHRIGVRAALTAALSALAVQP